MLREVIVKSDSVALVVAKIFAHGTRAVRRDVLQRCRFRGAGGDDDGVIHRARVGERLHDLRNRRALLPDAAVTANNVAALLIDDGVKDDGGLSGLAVSDDQLALPAPNGNHTVNNLDPPLHRLTHTPAIPTPQ